MAIPPMIAIVTSRSIDEVRSRSARQARMAMGMPNATLAAMSRTSRSISAHPCLQHLVAKCCNQVGYFLHVGNVLVDCCLYLVGSELDLDIKNSGGAVKCLFNLTTQEGQVNWLVVKVIFFVMASFHRGHGACALTCVKVVCSARLG